MSNVKIDIVSEFKGKGAFDKAGKSVGTLEKTVTNLAKKFAAIFAADKIANFAKESIKAFEEEQKSITRLSTVVKNLGLEFADPVFETFISHLSDTSGIVKDQLRPAFQSLLTTTKDARKSQELLTQAIDVSRGSGVDLATVAQDLANAYVGNVKGLKKYNLGLSQAELKTMSFTDIQKKLNQQFKGSNAAYLQTYAGKMQILATAATDSKEIIGKGLIDALSNLGNDTSVQDLADSMKGLATDISDVIYGIGQLVGALKTLAGQHFDWKKVLPAQYGAFINLLDHYTALVERAKNSKLQNSSVQMFMTDEANNRLNNTKIQQDKKILDNQKKLLAEQKKQDLLKKQSALFDIQQIEIIAALKGQLSDEDRKRAELQLALLQGNESEAAKLTAQIADSIDKTGQLKAYLNTVEATNDPFKKWMDSLEAIAAKAASITGASAMGGGSTPISPVVTPNTNILGDITAPTYTIGGTAGANGGSYGGQVQVNVNFQGSDSLTNALRDSFVSSSMEGSFSQINRTVGAFDR